MSSVGMWGSTGGQRNSGWHMATVMAESTRVGDPMQPLDSLEREAFEWFPYGVLLLDSTRRVIRRNREASRLIAALGLAEAQLTCCEVIGCGGPGTVLEAGCLTDLALARNTF